MYNSFMPGNVWLDTKGVPIQAHGGSVMYHDGVYYWYGENKEKSVRESICWHWGVRMYSSTDLYNWTNEGIVLAPEPYDLKSPLHPNSKMDRPHILYNEKYNMFVMWVKIMDKGDKQYMAVATADKITGPYTLMNKKLHPCGMNSGDFDLFLDDGTAYIIFERVHTDLIVMELTDDYLDVTDKYSVHFYRKTPPFVREAPAVFKDGDYYYMFTSGTTGKFPNPSEIARSTSMHGPWEVLGDPHIGDDKHTSFDSQISCVFKVQGSDKFIAIADRWLMDLPDDRPDIPAIYEQMNNPEIPHEYKITKLLPIIEGLTVKNTSVARYVWLPVEFKDGIPTLSWYDEWKL